MKNLPMKTRKEFPNSTAKVQVIQLENGQKYEQTFCSRGYIDDKTYIKRCPTSLDIRKGQIKSNKIS